MRVRLLSILALLAATTSVARAADITDIATAFDETNRFDFRLRTEYSHESDRAAIKREVEGQPGQTGQVIQKDLRYAYERDTLTLHTEFGIWHDLMLHVELPIILRETESLSFDKGVVCAAAGPNCNSSTVNDGIATPYDAQRGGVVATPPTLFRGAERGAVGGSGADALDTLNFGLAWAPFNQKRDHSKPTWLLDFESQISIGNIKRFERYSNTEHGVSEGIHRLFFRTYVSKRFHRIEPYMGLWYMLPIARSGSLFVDYGRAQDNKHPQQRAGSVFGGEFTAYENVKRNIRIGLDANLRVEAHFSGLGYSQIWEMLASSPALACNAASQNPACDPNQNANVSPKYNDTNGFTGITYIDSYATVGTGVAATAQITRFLHMKLGFDYKHDEGHLITGDDIGKPSNGETRVSSPSDYNPAYRPIIDQPGRRYLAEDINVYTTYLWAQLMF